MSAAAESPDADDRPQPTAHTSEGVTRRGALKRIGVSAGTIVTVGAGSTTVPRYSPIGRAAAVAPAVPIGILAGAAAVKYATGKTVGEHLLGDDRDYSGYTGADALHQEITAGTTEMNSADERVMTSIQNNISNSQNIALAKGKQAALEEMNAENSESAASDAMEAAIDDYYAVIQENLLTHFNSQQRQLKHHVEQVESHSDISPSSTHQGSTGTNVVSVDYLHESSETLLDGSSVPYELAVFFTEANNSYGTCQDWLDKVHSDSSTSEDYNGTGDGWYTTPMDYWSHKDYDDGSLIHYSKDSTFKDAWDAVIAERDDVHGSLSGFVSDVYSAYDPGDIPTEDIVDPVTAATEMNQDYEDRGFHSASAAMLGIPTNAEFSADLEIVDDEAEDGIWEVSADIFTAHVPTVDVADSASISSGVLTLSKEPVADSTYELTTTDSETVEFKAGDMTDNGDGTWEIDLSDDLSTTDTSVDELLEEDRFRIDTTYQPSGWSEPFYIAYSYVDEETGDTVSDFEQIESEFTVVKAVDDLGEEVDSFKNDSQNNQTADVDTLEEELAMIRDAQIRMQKEAEEEVNDDGSSDEPLFGGVFSDQNGGELAGLAIVALVIMGMVSAAINKIPLVGK